MAPGQSTAYTRRLCMTAPPVGKPPACLQVGPPKARGPVLPPSDSSELTVARCPDGAPARPAGALHLKAKRVGVLVPDCPRGGREATQGEVDRNVAGSVGGRGHVSGPAGLRRPVQNILCHACCRRRLGGRNRYTFVPLFFKKTSLKKDVGYSTDLPYFLALIFHECFFREKTSFFMTLQEFVLHCIGA